MFNSQTYGKLNIELVVDKLLEFYNRTKQYETPVQIIVGTDSQNHSETKVVTVIAITCEGHGGIYFYEVNYMDRIDNVRQKLFTETGMSLETADKILNGRVSIGCSYKGTVWSRWVETIDFWMHWCDQMIDKILDKEIDVKKILDGVLIPKEITEMPDTIPYRIDWPMELDLCNDKNFFLEDHYHKVDLMNVDIRLTSNDAKNGIQFEVVTDVFSEEMVMTIDDKGYHINHVNGSVLAIVFKRKEHLLIDFFMECPPRVKFIDQSTLEGNYYVTLTNKRPLQFPVDAIDRWDWKGNGVNINVESQGLLKKPDSIQYYVIKKLKDSRKYTVIFDDDDSGEIADVIAINNEKEIVKFEFYHCKYSHGQKPGHRVSDLYEVCGQAEKSVEWKQDMIRTVDRMIKREAKRNNDEKPSRFELGNIDILAEIKNRLRAYQAMLKIYIVQPGVDGSKISDDMNQVLMASKTYLKETYGIDLGLICS